MSALALSFLLVRVRPHGFQQRNQQRQQATATVKSKETTVTQSPDGTVTKTEESKKVTPAEKP